MDFDKCTIEQLSAVNTVARALTDRAGVDLAQVMLVGAEARDILHTAHGHDFPLRATTDVDIGIALSDWSAYEAIADSFPSTGNTGIRHIVAEISVDFMPFGDQIEHPAGTVAPRRRAEPMSVFAFKEVFDQAAWLNVGDDLTMRIPSSPGYAALKMKAWLDRWQANRETKDANDLATAVFWYSESSEVADRLYTVDSEALVTYELHVERAAAYLIGRDAMDLIGQQRAFELRTEWAMTDRDALATNFAIPSKPTTPFSKRLKVVDSLSDGILK